jgi:outer membrane receptor protein involved in Fe transport
MSALFVLVQAAAVAAAPVQGVTAYPAAFFAEYRPTTALDMVERLPGFTLDTGESVRGFEGAAGNVLIDGVRPASKSDDLDDIIARIPASQVERIELIRGGAPGVDMQGKSVLANIVRKAGGRTTGHVQLADYLAEDGRNQVHLRVEGQGAAAGGTWEASLGNGGGYDDGAGPTEHVVLSPNKTVLERSHIDAHGEVDDATATAAFERPFAGGKLRLNARGAYERYRGVEVNAYTFPSANTIASEEGLRETETEIGARFDKALTARTQLELIGIRQTDVEDYWSDATIPRDAYNFTQTTDAVETIARAVLKHRRDDRLSFELGGEAALNTLVGETALRENGAAVAIPAPHVDVEELRGEVFAKAAWRPAAEWNLEATVRQEGSRITADATDPDRPDLAAHTEKTLYFTKPRLAASWQPVAGTQLRARVERVVGQLDFEDFVASAALNEGVLRAGNVDLVPEQAWITEASVEQAFWGKGAVVFTLRRFTISDTIDRAPIFDASGVYDAPANIGEGVKEEAELSLNIPLDRLWLRRAEFRGAALLRRSEVTDPTTGEKREISGLRPLEWDAHFSQQLPHWKAAWGVDAYGGWRRSFYRFDEIQTNKLRTYVILFGEWKPGGGVTVRAEIENLTSRGFRRTRHIYAGPRSTSPLLLTDDRDIDVGRYFKVSVRKNFGG